MSSVKAVPAGYHTITPYLLVDGVANYIEFLKRAFDAKEDHRSAAPDGTVVHAEVRIGDSKVMMGQATGEWKRSSSMLYVYLEDVDAAFQKAVEAGATVVREVKDEFYGDRSGGLKDPSGNQWWLATHKEDLTPEELQKRFAAARK